MRLAIVIPAYNEARLIARTLRSIPSFVDLVVVVDDASRDGTRAALKALSGEIPQLRVLAHRTNSGQSRSVRTGILAARGPVIVTLDGDGQNDPAFLPKLIGALEQGAPRRVCRCLR